MGKTLNFKRILVLMGGRSEEREISLKSGREVIKNLKEMGFEVDYCEPEALCEKLKEFKPDFVFLALHGRYGEDGTVQGFLELMGIPYLGSDTKVSALCFDKDWTKRFLKDFGIKTPNWVCLREGEEVSWEKFPCVVKPARQGSSVGLFLVKGREELELALRRCFKFDGKVIIEEFVQGYDATVGILKGKVLPPIKIIPKKGIYDYESKYTKGLTRYEFLEGKVAQRLKETSLKIWKALELKDLARIDFRVSDEGEIYFLEVNTIPGMTELSLFPMACKKVGLNFKDFLKELLKDA